MLEGKRAAIKALLEACQEATDRQVERIQIDPHPSGQAGFQVYLRGEEYPEVGVITLEDDTR